MANKFIWDVTHSEKYIDKATGEEKTKYTKVWGLFFNEDYNSYSINFLGQWLNVFPKKENTQAKPKKENDDFISIEDIAF